MRTSLSTSVFLNFPLGEAIQRISVAGFDAIDVWGGRPHAYRNDLHEHEIQHIRGLINNLGMEIASFIPAQFRYPISLCSPDPHIRNDSISYLKTSVETAVRLAAPIVSVCPGHTLFGQDIDDGWNRLADSINKICEYAVHYDVLIALEPVDQYRSDLINTSIQAMDMIDQLDCDNLGVVFDTGNALIHHEDPASVFEILGERLFHIHISDNDGSQDQHLVPGHGNFDFENLIQVLKTIPYEGFLSGELGWRYTINPGPAAVETSEFLANLLD